MTLHGGMRPWIRRPVGFADGRAVLLRGRLWAAAVAPTLGLHAAFATRDM